MRGIRLLVSLALGVASVSVGAQAGGDATGAPTLATRPLPPAHSPDSVLISTDPEDGFTMVIATYRRDELLPDLLEHLTTTPPPSLRHILIVWQNVGVPLPTILLQPSLDDLSTSGVAVSVRLSKHNSMNERFRPFLDWNEHIDTEAVMIMDDDVILRREALQWGYDQFRAANPRGRGPEDGRIVGFTGRDWERTQAGEWTYVVQPRTSYSLVLSNAAWFRRSWLERYWAQDDEMVQLRAYVDQVFNCDDLLINYIVSNMTHLPPLLLQPTTPLRTVPTTDGLWNRGSDHESAPPSSSSTPAPERSSSKLDHFTQRLHCLSHYFSHFSTFAPPSPSPNPSFPLVRTTSSVSQDVVDHARWLHPGEVWEQANWVKQLTSEEIEKQRIETMLDNMSEEELDDLLAEMERQEAEEVGVEDEAGGEGESIGVDRDGSGGQPKTGRVVDEL
ncbi:hypothetical protein RQP46_001048 [Phenoliferia psychrophenolica]